MGWLNIVTMVIGNIPTIIKIIRMLPPLIEQIYELIEKFSKKKEAELGEPYKPEEKALMFNKAVARKVYRETGVALPTDLLDDVREKTWATKNPGKRPRKRVGKTAGKKADYLPEIDDHL